jgi:hypothetical protein
MRRARVLHASGLIVRLTVALVTATERGRCEMCE